MAAGLRRPTDHERAVYDLLRTLRTTVVPVVGAGLAAEAGAPSTAELRAALASACRRPPDADESLYVVADRLEAERGRERIAQVVAEAITAAPLRVTPTLLALARVPSRRVVTTNYDNAVEVAARHAGLEPVALLAKDVDQFLDEPAERTVHVLHLHGTASQPSSIVLTTASYRQVLDDKHIRYGLRVLASQHNLVFLGHSLGPEERHVRREITWAREAFPQGPREHLLLHRTGDLPATRLAEVEAAGVRPCGFDEREGRYQFTGRAAGVIGGGSALDHHREVPRVNEQRIDRWYVPVPLAPHDRVRTDEDRREWRFDVRFRNLAPSYAEGLEERSRLLLVAHPGYGKSQTLYQLGSQEPSRALHVELGLVPPPERGADPEQTFLTWLVKATAFGPSVARPDRDELAKGAYTFLLDALDEVPAEHRGAVLDVVVAVADRYPQHRFVLTSRPLTLLDQAREAGFERHDLLPDDDWLADYARARGLDPDAVVATLTTRVPAVAELCRIPLFAAAAVGRIAKGRELPDTPLGLVMTLADEGVEWDTTRLPIDRAAVTAWLNRLALTMELAGVAVMDRRAVLAADLTAGLTLRDTPQLIDRLVERALLAEDGDRVRFPTNLVQEARAAAALLAAPHGLLLLTSHVLLDVNGERAVRPSFAVSVELLLGQASAEWRAIVAAYDPLAVARTTPLTATGNERGAAIAAIAEWYRHARIWLPRHEAGELVDDRRALELLARQGVPPALLDEVRRDLGAGERERRGNAVVVLHALGDDAGVRAALPALVRDPDSVVRRHAGVIAERLRATEVSADLRAQLVVDGDELARRTLAGAAIALAADEDLPALLDELAPETRVDVLDSLDKRWTPSRQLQHLEDQLKDQAEVDPEWFTHVLEAAAGDANFVIGGTAGRAAAGGAAGDTALSDEDLRRAVRIGMTHTELHSREPSALRRLATERPAVVVGEALLHLRDHGTVFLVGFLFDAMRALPADRLLALVAAAPELGRQVIDEHLRWRDASEHAPPHDPLWPPRRTFHDVLAAATDGQPDVDELLRLPPPHNPARELGDDQRAALTDRIAGARERWEAQHGPVVEVLRRGDDGLIERDPEGFGVLRWCAALRLPLDRLSWLHLARLGCYDHWLSVRFDATWTAGLAADVADWTTPELMALAPVVPEPWPPGLAERLARVCYAHAGDASTRRLCAERLADNRQLHVLVDLRAAHDDVALDEALIRCGDCQAETRLLTGLLAEPASMVLDHLPDRSRSWLGYVRCRSSTQLLVHLLRRLWGTAKPSSLAAVHRALQRAAGAHGLDVYDGLMADPSLPGASFLWYQRRELLDSLLEQHARQVRPADWRELGDVVTAALTGTAEP